MHIRHLSRTLLCLTITLVGCTSATGTIDGSSSSSVSSADMSSPMAETTPEAIATAVLQTLKAKDMTGFAALSHPTLGVRFTPFTSIDDQDVVLKPTELTTAMQDSSQRHWGVEDASGLPIDLSFAQYYDKYIWDHDFTQAPTVTWNQTMNHGSSTDNAREFYGPDAQIVEYHFDGFDPQYEGMDWASLRLVFKKDTDGKWYLVGVIRDRWGP